MSRDGVLTDRERREIERCASHYPEPRAASVEALKIVQRDRRWVSDEALVAVAELLGLDPADLENVATFYNLVFRRPVGKHVILLCDSVSCWVMGYGGIRDRLRELLGIDFGETTPDGRFTLLPMPCLGACDGAPAMMVGDDLHVDVDPDELEALLERYPTREDGP